MNKNNSYIALAGFLCFFIGFLSMVLNLIGIDFVFLNWVDNWGKSLGWLIRFIITVVGLIIALKNLQQHEIDK